MITDERQFSIVGTRLGKRFLITNATAWLRLGPTHAARLILLLLLALPAVLYGKYDYTTNNGAITITGYTGPDGAVMIPDTIDGLPVTTIEGSAFYNFTSVTIPNSVTSLGLMAFSGCTRLAAITVDASNSVYSSMDGVLFNKNQTTLIEYPAGKADKYTIPNSVTCIGDSAFSGCSSLTNVTIPNSVFSIGNSAFSQCLNLTSVAIGTSVTNIGEYAFSSCISLNSVTIPNNVTRIENWGFWYCTNLTNVTIGNRVTSVGTMAFYGCSSLTGVYFKGNAPSLGGSVFDDNAKNATVYYLAGTTGWKAIFGGRPTKLWTPQVPP